MSCWNIWIACCIKFQMAHLDEQTALSRLFFAEFSHVVFERFSSPTRKRPSPGCQGGGSLPRCCGVNADHNLLATETKETTFPSPCKSREPYCLASQVCTLLTQSLQRSLSVVRINWTEEWTNEFHLKHRYQFKQWIEGKLKKLKVSVPCA